MALDVTVASGDFEVQIKYITRLNMAQMITDGLLTAADYPEIKGGLMEFRLICDVMFAQFNTDLTVAGLVSIDGNSWREVRDQVAANFALVDGVVNP